MIEAYELTLRQRIQQEKDEAQDAELAQPIWKDIFSSCEELLKRDSKPQSLPGRSRWQTIFPGIFIAPLVNVSPHLPFKAFQDDDVWLLEKPIELDGETQTVTFLGRSRRNRHLKVGVGVGGIFVELFPAWRGKISVSLYQDGELVIDAWRDEEAGTKDAHFFQEILAKARAQAPATTTTTPVDS